MIHHFRFVTQSRVLVLFSRGKRKTKLLIFLDVYKRQPEELPGLLECAHALPSLRVRGLMSIPPAADAPGARRPYFAQMRGLFERAQAAQGGNVSMEYLLSLIHI